jgi:hypothetical protein
LLEDIDQRRAAGRASSQAPLMFIDALKPRCRSGSRHEAGTDGGPARDRTGRHDHGHQFSGPEVFNRPVI